MGTTALNRHLDTCLYLTDLGSLWIMLFGVIQEGRHVVVQISLETVDQVPAPTDYSLLPTTDVTSNYKLVVQEPEQTSFSKIRT